MLTRFVPSLLSNQLSRVCVGTHLRNLRRPKLAAAQFTWGKVATFLSLYLQQSKF